MLRYAILLVFGLILSFPSPSFSQAGEAHPSAQARAVLDVTLKTLGGERLLKIQTVTGKGMFTQFDEKGELTFLAKFIDYIVYPDKERTEFGQGKKRLIQTNAGSTGWIYDGPQQAIRDQPPEQIENFKRGIRRNLDQFFRRLRGPDAQLLYLGEKEIWFRQRGQGIEIRFQLENGSEEIFELYIDPLNHQPVQLVYGNEEDRFFLYREIDGVTVPLRIDHYEDGRQTSRIAYGSLEFNRPIDLSLFEKPSDPKKVK